MRARVVALAQHDVRDAVVREQLVVMRWDLATKIDPLQKKREEKKEES